MANPKLEEYQRKARNKDLQRGDVSFTCNDSNVICDESAQITLESEGIRLHFLRYGLFDKEILEDDVEAPKAILTNGEEAETLLINNSTGEVINVNNTTGKSTKGIVLDEVIVENNPFEKFGMPKLKNFSIARTALSNGYIYLINDEDPDEYYELKIDQNGFLSHVLWEYSKDEEGNYLDYRKSEREKISYKIVEKGKKLRIAFSPVQWSRDYFDEINGSKEKKEELMTLLDCSGFEKGFQAEETAFAIPFNQVKAAFPPDHTYTATLEDNLNDIFITEREQTKKEEEGGEVNEILEDMFITFHDPIACANDIHAGLAEQNFRLQALVEAIRTGCTEKFAYDRISTLSTTPPKEPTEDYKNMFSLALAAYQFVYSDKKSTETYDGGSVVDSFFETKHETQFPYQPSKNSYYKNGIIKNGPRNRKPKGYNYQSDSLVGNGLHREKVEGVLGVHQRRARREKVISYRDDLGNWIQTDYFDTFLSVYKDNPDECKVFGMEEIYKHINVLYLNPYDIDRSLLLNANNKLEVDRYFESDKWIDWINILRDKDKSKNNNLEILFTSELTIKQLFMDNWIDLSNKFAGLINNMLGVYSINSHFFNKKRIIKKGGKVNYEQIISEAKEFTIPKLNKIKVERTIDGVVEETLTYSKSNGFQLNANIYGGNFDRNLTITILGPNDRLLSQFKAETIEHIRNHGRKVKGGKMYNQHDFKKGAWVEDITKKDFYSVDNLNLDDLEVNDRPGAIIDSQRFNEKAYKVLNSRGLTSVITSLQVINFTHASLSLFDSLKNGDIEDLSKNAINTYGIALELQEAATRLHMAHFKASSKTITHGTLSTFDAKITKLGRISGVITAGMCVWDGIIAIRKRDRDAGVAFILSGVAFGVATFLSGPIGWIVMGVGLLLLILAHWLTDTELEYFFKHFMYSDYASKPSNGMSAMEYNRYLFKVKGDLVRKDDHEDLLLPEDAIARFHDIIVCPKIEYFTDKQTINLIGNRSTTGFVRINTIGVRLTFTKFLSDPNKIEAQGMFFHSYNSNTNNQFKPLTLRNKKIEKLKNGQQQFQALVDIPKDGNSDEFILAIRLAIDESKNYYFPYPLSNYTNKQGKTEIRNKRYLAAKFDLEKSIYHSSGKWSEATQDLIVDTLPKLKLPNTW